MDFMLFFFAFFFKTTTKMFLSEHLKVYLHQKVIANQRTKKGTMITVEDSPACSDEESEFSVSPHKARTRLH